MAKYTLLETGENIKVTFKLSYFEMTQVSGAIPCQRRPIFRPVLDF
jgi:hypothetical protein